MLRLSTHGIGLWSPLRDPWTFKEPPICSSLGKAAITKSVSLSVPPRVPQGAERANMKNRVGKVWLHCNVHTESLPRGGRAWGSFSLPEFLRRLALFIPSSYSLPKSPSCQEGQKYYGGKKPCGWGLRLTLELDVHGIDLQEKSHNSQRPEDYGFS